MGVMSAYRATIGLEIHAELKTQTKMFCDSKNDPNETRPNVNICAICLAHPGTLPTINKQAVAHVLRVGSAVGGTLADVTEFDRKSYFYPDIPKGYQISQYEHPLVKGGVLSGIAITRVHLEEDTARSTHSAKESLVDFNRAGIPLMELVTEPVIHDAITAGNFARELQLLLRTLGTSDANLEKGEMRIEANISVSNTDTFGTKVEVKNLNSFRSVERAIAYEIERQSTLLKKGEGLVQETRGWDETTGKTFHQRFKEGSADYRYFPEPDLPKMVLSGVPEFSTRKLKEGLPELPSEKRNRFSALGLKRDDVEFFLQNNDHQTFFECILSQKNIHEKETLLAVNYIVSDIAGALTKGNTDVYKNLSARSFAELISMITQGGLSSRGAKEVLTLLMREGGDTKDIVEKNGLRQVSSRTELESNIKNVLEANQTVVDEYRSGKENALQYLVGQTMKQTKGAGNPELITEILKEALK